MREGDWLLMEYGFDKLLFYILDAHSSPKDILLGRKNWLVSSSIWIPRDEINSKATIIGSTERRWWRKFTPFKDLICPFKRLIL